MRVVRIARTIGVRVMLPVLGNPFNGAALKGERTKNGERILNGLRHDQASMGEEPVETKSDPECGYDIQYDRDCDTRPRKKHRQENTHCRGMDEQKRYPNRDIPGSSRIEQGGRRRHRTHNAKLVR